MAAVVGANPPIIGREVVGVSFAVYTADDIRRLSVKKITNPVLFDNLNNPTRHGLYDPALGPTDKDEACATCALNFVHCPGHLGHIELALPVYNPVFFNAMFQLLRCTCLYCHRLKATSVRMRRLIAQLRLLDFGLLLDAMQLENACAPPAAADEEGGKDRDYASEEIAAIDAYYLKALERGGLDPKRSVPNHRLKTRHTGDLRRQLINEFLKTTASAKRCNHCLAVARTLRRDGYSKIFALPLARKHQMKADAQRMKERALAGKGGDSEDEEGEDVGSDSDAEMEEVAATDTQARKGKSAKNTKSKSAESSSGSESSSESESELDSDDEPAKGKPNGKGAAAKAKAANGGKSGAKAPAAEKKKAASSSSSSEPSFVSPVDARGHLEAMWAVDGELATLVYGALRVDGRGGPARRAGTAGMFFLDVVPVPPSRFRPASKMGDQVFENPQNVYLGNILRTNVQLLELRAAKEKAAGAGAAPDISRVVNIWIQLQTEVNCLMDSALGPTSAGKPTGPAGIRQTLEKKEGLFRKHMMGKRVNYAARSVISPDPYIETSEIGIPQIFAKKLTYPEPVTPFNVEELRRAVINGPDVHPGATHIQHENGTLSSLANFGVDGRTALANQLLTPHTSADGTPLPGKKVLRHLRNGDVLLLNRQPTLHKPSMMAHRARVLPGEKTIRLHYANCDTYNADFDGDEMNVHFPQNEIARAEAYMIANTDNQYLVPTDGEPLRGLIQDHVVAGARLSKRDTFLDRQRYQQLVYSALPENGQRVRLLPPCVIRPRPQWSGKQVISTVLLNLTRGFKPLNLIGKSKIPAKMWGPNSEEGVVIIRCGELLCGSLDKAQFGASAFGLVHSCQELYGAEIAGKLLTALGRLFTAYLQFDAFTLGMEDIMLLPRADKKRRELMASAATIGAEEVARYVGQKDWRDGETLAANLERVYRSDAETAGLDAVMKTRLNKLTSEVIASCLPDGQLRPFPRNNLALMINSGAKGSMVNFSQISCLLGQQELEGRRVPVMVSGKTLPSFVAFDPSARAGGYVMGRFLTGIRPQEYFFHCMAGREGLVDTAVKTSRSGYLQRCLIKHLEGLRVHYDMTVRDDDGSVIQFNYGEDSLEPARLKFLDRFAFVAQNYDGYIQKLEPGVALSVLDPEKAIKRNARALRNPAKHDPVLSTLQPDRFLGSVSEAFTRKLEEYVAKDPEGVLARLSASRRMTREQAADKLRALMYLKYRTTLAQPGEAVGVVAGQSIGEPSTQMTLNTFHFAGFGAMNVTLGIPRLREVLMTASTKIKTPVMRLPIAQGREGAAEKLRRALTRLSVADVLQSVQVNETLTQKDASSRQRTRLYTIRLETIARTAYEAEHGITSDDLYLTLETTFIRKLVAALLKALQSKGAKAMTENIGKGTREKKAKEGSTGDGDDEEGADAERTPAKAKGDDDADSEDGDASGDDDAAVARSKANRKELATYDADEDLDSSERDASEQSGPREADGSDVEMEDAEGEAQEAKAHAAPASPKKSSKGKKGSAAAEVRKDRVRAVLSVSPNVHAYDYDENGEWCTLTLKFPAASRKLLLVSIIEQVSRAVLLRSTRGIQRCIVADDVEKTGRVTLQTEGVNITGMWQYFDIIDVNKIATNDIYAILVTYGVEAARQAIVGEVASVFQAYGISVDRRHLMLIADYMTYEGGYKPFNRMGIESNVSPFLKMSFETTCHFLRSASMHGDYEPLQSPSARLVVGRVVGGGTGCFDVLQPLE